MTKKLLKKINPVFEDNRGAIFDILDGVEIKHVGIITSRAGAVRGNHYHKIATQYLYVLEGRVEVTNKDLKGVSSTVIIEKGDLIAHRPTQIHTIKSLGDSTVLVLTTSERKGREGYEKDTYRIKVNTP